MVLVKGIILLVSSTDLNYQTLIPNLTIIHRARFWLKQAPWSISSRRLMGTEKRK
jgi:hypothetical protein